MAEAKLKTRSGKEFKKENEDEDLEAFAPMRKTVQKKVNSKLRNQVCQILES